MSLIEIHLAHLEDSWNHSSGVHIGVMDERLRSCVMIVAVENNTLEVRPGPYRGDSGDADYHRPSKTDILEMLNDGAVQQAIFKKYGHLTVALLDAADHAIEDGTLGLEPIERILPLRQATVSRPAQKPLSGVVGNIASFPQRTPQARLG